MENYKKLLVLAASSLVLAGCGAQGEGVSSSSSKDSSSNSSVNGSWSEEDKALLKKYCGEVLPYPAGFKGEAYVDEIVDEDEGTSYLQIVNASRSLTIGDYYTDLEKAGWTGIHDYNGDIAQSDSAGTRYYELINTSSDNQVGYDLTYFFSSSNGTGYNVIQCYNDLDTTLDTATSWSDSDSKTFEETLTIVPAKLSLGLTNGVYSASEDFAYACDLAAIDLTSTNVKILKDDGWKLDEELSKEHSSYVLEKDAIDGAPVYASVYYFSGNYVTFSYTPDVHESSSWPTEFVSSFENKFNFTIPEFSASDISTYYYYTKNGTSYIYSYTDSDTIYSDYDDALKATDAIFDNYNRWYTDWGENFVVKGEWTLDYDTYEYIFRVSFSELDEPYDDIVTGWPGEKLSSFLSSNNMSNVTIPTFEVSSYSAKQELRLDVTNYEDAYKEAYEAIKEDPDWYDIFDPSDEEEIKAKADEVAKQNTLFSVKIYDPEDSKSTHPAYEYLLSTLSKASLSRVNSQTFDAAYEDANGTVLIGVSRFNNVTTLTYGHGSGTKHEPAFYFATTNMSVKAGNRYKLNLVCDMLSGNITYSSDNDKFVVDSEGYVTVSAEAEEGDSATITATILADGESTPRTATCFMSWPPTYTPENTASKIAKLYNDHFNLTSEDVGYASPSETSEGYSFSVSSTSVTSIEAMEEFVASNLILDGFGDTSDGEWNSGEYSDGTAYEYLECIAYNDDEEGTAVQLFFEVFINTDGSIGLKVSTCDW